MESLQLQGSNYSQQAASHPTAWSTCSNVTLSGVVIATRIICGPTSVSKLKQAK